MIRALQSCQQQDDVQHLRADKRVQSGLPCSLAVSLAASWQHFSTGSCATYWRDSSVMSLDTGTIHALCQTGRLSQTAPAGSVTGDTKLELVSVFHNLSVMACQDDLCVMAYLITFISADISVCIPI